MNMFVLWCVLKKLKYFKLNKTPKKFKKKNYISWVSD